MNETTLDHYKPSQGGGGSGGSEGSDGIGSLGMTTVVVCWRFQPLSSWPAAGVRLYSRQAGQPVRLFGTSFRALLMPEAGNCPTAGGGGC